MPNLDGIKVLEEIKTNSEYHKPKHIIAITAFANDKVMQKCAELGADYFVVKPVNMTNLLEIINNLKEEKNKKIIVSPMALTNLKETAENICNP